MSEITYWEKNFSGDIYNTNPTAKVGVNNGDPLNTLDVIGNIGLSSFLEMKKSGHDVIQISAASAYGYDFKIVNVTDQRDLLYVDNLGRLAVNASSNTARLTIMEDREGNAWPAASFTNTSETGFGLEVTGGNFDNHILTLKNYNDDLRGTLNGGGEWWTKSSMTSDNATSVDGMPHFIQANENFRFAQLLIDLETGHNNEGSNFIWRRYADDGTLLANILKVIRNSGLMLWYGDSVFNGDVTISGKLTVGEDDRTLEQIKDPTGEEGKVLVVVDGVYDFVDPLEAFKPDLSDYPTLVEVEILIEDLSDSIPVIIHDYLEGHPFTLDDVAKNGNTTDEVLISTTGLVAPLVTIGGIDVSNIGGTLTIDGDTYVKGLLTFDDIHLKLHQLLDVANSVENAGTNSFLKKISGTWYAVPWEDPDLSDYYNKEESNGRFVKIPGDTMTGGLIIGASDFNLRLNASSGSTSFSIYDDGGGDARFNIIHTDDDITVNYLGDDYYLKRSDIGTIMHVDVLGTVHFGDETETIPGLGNIVIDGINPTLSLNNLNGGAFRFFASSQRASFQVGTDVSFADAGTPLVLSKTSVELNFNDVKQLETVVTGVRVHGDTDSRTMHVDGVHIYKDTDGTYVIDGEVAITGRYLEEWSGPGTGHPPGAWTLDELHDVDLNADTVGAIGFPFLLGRDTPTGEHAKPLTVDEVIEMLDVVIVPDFEEHTGDDVVHITPTERRDWNIAFDYVSNIKDWDLSYTTYGRKEIGLAHKLEEGTAIGRHPLQMKYMFYWDSGTKWSIKTRFSDDASHLAQKPADEHRYTRATEFTLDNCDTLFNRSLYDMGTTTMDLTNVPEDGSWQVETLDASYIFNQNEAENIKHKHQWAIEWVDREDYFNMWARTHDGSVPEWLPWVKFFHSGNMPDALELYPVLPIEAYDTLQNELNWMMWGEPAYEVYIGSVVAPTWELNIGQRVVDNYYIYEATPTGVRRQKRGVSFLYELLDVNFSKYGTTGEPDEGDVLVYEGDGSWVTQPGSYIVQELTITDATATMTIEPNIDRLELTLEAGAPVDFDVVINHNREKPVVIDLTSPDTSVVTVSYTDEVNANEILITLVPGAIIEVHPGVWELN